MTFRSLLVIHFLCASAIAFGQQASSSEPWLGEMGIRHTTAELMQRQKQSPVPAAARIHVLRRNPGRENLPQNPQSSSLDQSTKAATQLPSTQAAVAAPQTISAINFTGATLSDTSAFPPDTMGTVGPTQFLVVLNGRIRSFDKTTGLADGVLNVNTDVFFSSVMTPTLLTSTTDPKVRYDRLSGRWIIIMIDAPFTGANRVMIAVSDSGTIGQFTTWTYFYFQHDQVAPAGDAGDFADYPTLGVDANALYIGVNVFTPAKTFVETTGFVVRKSSILAWGPIVVTAFRGLAVGSSGAGPFTPQGVDNFDPAATEGYFIGNDNAGFGTLMIRRISDPGGTPTISDNLPLTVAATSLPRSVQHLGNTGGTIGNLDSSDDRLFAAVMRNGHLWTAHNMNVTTSGAAAAPGATRRGGSRWYEIQNLSSTPSLVQYGTVFDSTSSKLSYFIPSIMVSGQGHAAMGFSVAGANSHIDAATTGRLAGDSAGTMQTIIRYTSSSTAYNPSGDTGGSSGRRWGDYSYTSVDPDDDMTMWTIQEFCNATNSYGVQAVKLLAPLPATPASCAPSSAPHGATNVNVIITGSPSSGSGFFDPGNGFPNHLTASVNGGGVTVNSVTYTDPTHCTVNLTVASNAALGAQTITVTNPDGQAVTSASGIFTVTPSSNLSVAASVSPSVVAAGGKATYTLSVTNNGPDTATGVVATDTLPSGVVLLSATPSPASVIGRQVTFNLGSIASGATSTISMIVFLPSPSTAAGTVSNIFSATANEADPDAANNSATLSSDALPSVSIARSGTNIVITFSSVAGKFYRVQKATDLVSGFTTTLANQVPGTGQPVSVTDFGAASSFSRRFYRVGIVPGP